MSSLILARFNVHSYRSFSKSNPFQLLYRPQCLFYSRSLRSKQDPTNEANTTNATLKTYSVRRTWSQQDTDRLLNLVSKYGNKWKVFTNYFPGRTSFCIRSHYFSVTHDTTRWTLEEKKILQRHLGTEEDPEKIDWEAIQTCLPRKRTVARIKQFWQNSIHPLLNRGSWTRGENEQLKQLISTYGKDWETISKQIGTRSEDQCRNKWAYEVTTMKKGEFTKEEDEALTRAIEKYGIDEFQKIKQEMNSLRSISQLRTRYNNFLDPNIDKSPWTKQEKEVAAKLFAELKNIRAVKLKMNSKRSIRDMYNQLRNK